jgi:predicted nucleotidyltransferase component of viral defense system
MILAKEIKSNAGAVGIDPMIIERDYVLGCFLSFLATNPEVNNYWLFKGGTSLRKCHFLD